MKQKIPTGREVRDHYEDAASFNRKINLYDTVKVNEDFFIGNQWEGVESNGLPTPVFNFLKQVVNFSVSSITSDNFALKATAMPGIGVVPKREMEDMVKVVNQYYDYIIERNRITKKIREFLRNAAVDGDGCMYFYFDPNIENGQKVKGDIVAEIVQNTRVHFGNPNSKDVQEQPWIIISRRALVEDIRWEADALREAGLSKIDPESIIADDEIYDNQYDRYTDDKVTVLKYFFRNKETGTIWCMDVVGEEVLREAYDTELNMYPVIWLNWDYKQDCYHGQALISGLIPNQKFVNKMFALVGVSQLATAFPKIVYDKTKVKSWDGSVGTALGVNGNVEGVAKVIEGAPVNPQIVQFMEFSMSQTKSLLGATDVAMGDSRPDNTSAIIALQRAAATPMEMTKQNLYRSIEEMGRILLDIMATNYGTRTVELDPVDPGMGMEPIEVMGDFDFSRLKGLMMNVQQDAGASSYWSEVANMQTLDNLLMNGHISVLQYLERVPAGYVAEKTKLIADIQEQQTAMMQQQMAVEQPAPTGTGMSKESIDQMDVPTGSGYGALQRAINQTGGR